MAREARAIGSLVRISLHRADLVQRLVDVRGHVGNAVLAFARQAPHAPAEEQDRHQRRRHAEEHEERELPAGDEQHHRRADHHQGVANEHRQAVADHLLQQRSVVGEPREHFAGAPRLEERRVEAEQMVEGGAPQVGDHALAGAHHQVEAEPGRAGERGGEHQQRHQRLVEQARLAAAETAGASTQPAATIRASSAAAMRQR